MEKADETTLAGILGRRTRPGELYRPADEHRLECFACGHRCLLAEGREGICRVRFNRGGVLHVPHGYVGGIQLDPVEKKPFFHAMPGSIALSFGMLGCDYHCSYCQNWITSQALRDPAAVSSIEEMSAEDMVALAVKHEAAIVTSTYNEPLITSEWSMEVFKVAKRYGLVTSYVSNGNGTPEVLDYLRPVVDLYKVDLKGFNDRQYRKLGGVLGNVLETIAGLHRRGFWVEVVTLLVPGFNDSEEEIRDVARFLVSVSPDIPWHVTAFHADYKMNDAESTPVRTLLRAAETGYTEGLHYVYAGNIPGGVRRLENTYCHHCQELLVERLGYRIVRNVLCDGRCPKCSNTIPGYWRKPSPAG